MSNMLVVEFLGTIDIYLTVNDPTNTITGLLVNNGTNYPLTIEFGRASTGVLISGTFGAGNNVSRPLKKSDQFVNDDNTDWYMKCGLKQS